MHYISHGERINPNLYENGKVCLSLLGTWTGRQSCELWNPEADTVLRVRAAPAARATRRLRRLRRLCRLRRLRRPRRPRRLRLHLRLRAAARACSCSPALSAAPCPQVLVSIQALVLCEMPYFNEAGYEKQQGTSEGAHHARR